MTEERNALTDLFAACWKDDTLKARFMADNTVHITLPMAPGGHEELSMEELSNVAGGGGLISGDEDAGVWFEIGERGRP